MRLRNPRVDDQDQMASRIPDASSDDPVLALWMGIGLEAREEPSPHPDRVGAERQRSSNGPAIGNATAATTGTEGRPSRRIGSRPSPQVRRKTSGSIHRKIKSEAGA